MKKIALFISLIGLVLSFSSCEDSFSMDEEKSFMPIMYEAKTPEVLGTEATTLLIKGIGDLVFDEIEKTDWKIITKYHVEFRGSRPLELVDDEDHDGDVTYTVKDALSSIPTNYEELLLTYDKLKVTYNYLGSETVLQPDGGLKLVVSIEELKKEDEPLFMQSGNIVFRLCVGALPVKIHKLPFGIFATDEEIDKWIKEQEEAAKKEEETNKQ